MASPPGGAGHEAGMINALLGASEITAHASDSFLIRNFAFIQNIDQLVTEGWSRLRSIDCDPFDDDTERYVLSYRLSSDWRELANIEIEVMISGHFPWHTLSSRFVNAGELEERLVDRFGLQFSSDEKLVEAGPNRVSANIQR